MQIQGYSDAMAAGAKSSSSSSSGFDVNTIGAIANTTLSMYSQFLGQKQQMLQQQIASANNQRIMSQLSPACARPDGTACYTSKAKFFPECTLPASMSNIPMNACNNATPEVNQISSMITYESVAQGWMNYYDQMSNEASNATYATGLRCLADKGKAMDSQLTEMVNNLQRLQDKMNQDKQVFRDSNKKLLEDMSTANDELYGISKNNLQIRTQDFAKFFSQGCQSVIGKDNLKNAMKEGMNGILQNLSSANKSAADFNLNKNAIQDDITKETNKIAATIKSNGVENFLKSGYVPQSDESARTFVAITTQIQKQATEYNTAKERIDKLIAGTGYKGPSSVDGNYDNYFKKKYVNDCVNNPSKGVSMPIEDILKSIEQRSTNNAGTARNDYVVALKRILNTEDSIEVKLSNIKDLQNKYPDITLTYKDSSQFRVTENPYNLFSKTMEKCNQLYADDTDFASSVSDAKAAVQELQNLKDNYSSKVTQGILSQVLECGGSAIKAGTCSEGSLDTSKPGFCISQASSCANDILGCYAEANTQVQKRKTKMENLSKAFNANVASMVARSNALYDQQKVAIAAITANIQSKFPGTNFEIPKDMFIGMPELSKDKFGVEMAGNGDLNSFLEGENSMPAKIDKLKKIFQDQKAKVKEATDEYYAQQKAAMDRERGRWEKLAGDCKGAIDSSSKGLAKANADGQKNQGEIDGLVVKYCDKYSNLKDNPNGACDEAKSLVDIWGKIQEKGAQGRVSGKAASIARQYDSACKALKNESTEDLSPDKCRYKKDADEKELCVRLQTAQLDKLKNNTSAGSVKPVRASALCKSDDASNSDFIANAISYLPSKDQETLKNINNLDALVEKIDKEKIMDNDFFAEIKDFIHNPKSEANICSLISDEINIEKDSKYKEYNTNKLAAEQRLKDATDENVRKNLNAEIDRLDKKISDVESKNKDKDKKYKELRTSIAAINSPQSTTTEEGARQKLSSLGENIDESCDAMNTNSLVKNSSGSGVYDNFLKTYGATQQ